MRRSMSTSHRSGTTFGALPPEISAAFTVGRPTSGCSRSGSTSGRRSRNRAIDVIAFTPRCGCEPWAAFPYAVAVNHAPPRSASPTCSSLGSPTIAASWVSRPRSHSTFVPCIAGELLVGGQVEDERAARSACLARRKRGRGRERRRDRPFHVGRPPADEASRVVDLARPGVMAPGVERSGRHDIEVAVPREARAGAVADRRDHARAACVGSHDLRRGPEAREDLARHRAASSSVPPGFSLFAAMSARAYPSTSSASTEAAAAASKASSTMARDATRRRARIAHGSARARSSTLARPRRPPGRRARAVRARARAGADLHGSRRRAVEARRRDLVPRRARRTRARPWPRRRCARRRRRSGSTRRSTTLLGALPSVHTFVSGILVVPFVGRSSESLGSR